MMILDTCQVQINLEVAVNPKGCFLFESSRSKIAAFMGLKNMKHNTKYNVITLNMINTLIIQMSMF